MTDRRASVQPPPLWARWVLASVIAAGVIAAIVIAVNRAGPEPASSETQVEAEDNRIADLAITADEAPHSAALPAGSLPATALERAISSDVRHRIASGQLTGPLQRVECKSRASRSIAARKPYRCTVRSDAVDYPFLAVLESAGRRLVWCKIDPSSVAGVAQNVPISARCRA
jgi:hypothetical protein